MILTGGVKRERCRLHISHERVKRSNDDVSCRSVGLQESLVNVRLSR